MRRTSANFLLAFVAATCCEVGAAADDTKLPLNLSVQAGERNHTHAPVSFAIPSGLAADGLRLTETTGGKSVPVAAQLDSQNGRLCWVATGPTAAGNKRTYRLEKGAGASAPAIALANSDQAVEVRFEGKPLLRYNKAHVEPPAGVDEKVGRGAHLHPVWTPSGAIVTDELPPDHLHQSGIFLAHTRTQFEGRNVDFWNLAGGKGRVRFKELKNAAGGPVYAQFRSEHEHVDLTASDDKLSDDKSEIGKTAGGKVALVETWDVRISNPGWKSGYWLLDIESSVRCAGESPVHMPEYHYGGMAIRAARPWTPQHVNLLTSEGDERLKGNHTRPRWCEVNGQIDGRTAGIALMTHPSNFRFPEPLRIHPTMPYMVYTPSFLGDWDIRPGTSHLSRYRFIVHDGNLTPETLNQLWQDYAQPLVAVAE